MPRRAPGVMGELLPGNNVTVGERCSGPPTNDNRWLADVLNRVRLVRWPDRQCRLLDGLVAFLRIEPLRAR
jgi:hypothetical protein